MKVYHRVIDAQSRDPASMESVRTPAKCFAGHFHLCDHYRLGLCKNTSPATSLPGLPMFPLLLLSHFTMTFRRMFKRKFSLQSVMWEQEQEPELLEKMTCGKSKYKMSETMLDKIDK